MTSPAMAFIPQKKLPCHNHLSAEAAGKGYEKKS